MSEFAVKVVALLIIVALIIGAIAIITGDMTLVDMFFSLFRYHG